VVFAVRATGEGYCVPVQARADAPVLLSMRRCFALDSAMIQTGVTAVGGHSGCGVNGAHTTESEEIVIDIGNVIVNKTKPKTPAAMPRQRRPT
jgi:hypothetical protein